jgi:DNA-binding MarR family transcriptional regulator
MDNDTAVVARANVEVPVRLDPVELAAWQGFLRAHRRLLQALDAELLAAHDLSLSSYDVLVQLDEAPDGQLRMSQLAEEVLLSRSGLTRLVERLEGEGLVARASCPDDARGSFAVLSDEGRARLEHARPTHRAGVRRRFIAPRSADELRCLAELWPRVTPPPAA